MKIYAVYENGGSWEDRYHALLKCFKDVKKAENYIKELEDTEASERAMAEKCASCDGKDTNCPMWLEPYDKEDECENYFAFVNHEPVNYEIQDAELEE